VCVCGLLKEGARSMGTFRADYSRTEPPGWLAGQTHRAQRPLTKSLIVCVCVSERERERVSE